MEKREKLPRKALNYKPNGKEVRMGSEECLTWRISQFVTVHLVESGWLIHFPPMMRQAAHARIVQWFTNLIIIGSDCNR